MSAPLKPWESNYNGRILQSSSSVPNNMISTPVGRMRMTPPVPPRPNTVGGSQYNSGYNNNYGGYTSYNRGYGSTYSPYSTLGMGQYGNYMGGYSGFGGYGGYNGYGGPMNSYGYNGAESSFIQLAEESTRPAFQSIESVVRAFSGISMMMDSTFFAITSSFRAVLGIADNLGQLRSMFGQIWSSFALFRLVRWAYRKLLAMFGVNTGIIGGNQAWETAASSEPGNIPTPSGHNWPIFLFLGIILSAPYLISKMIPTIDTKRRNPSQWPSPGVQIKVLYEFQAGNPQEMSIYPGETITIAPRPIQEEMGVMNSGWVYAAKNNTVGIVPRNYLQPPTIKRTESNADIVEDVKVNVPENEISQEKV